MLVYVTLWRGRALGQFAAGSLILRIAILLSLVFVDRLTRADLLAAAATDFPAPPPAGTDPRPEAGSLGNSPAGHDPVPDRANRPVDRSAAIPMTMIRHDSHRCAGISTHRHRSADAVCRGDELAGAAADRIAAASIPHEYP